MGLTYHDPGGGTIDIGVVVLEDEPVVRRHFGRFGVELASPALGGGGGTTAYVDFRTGRPVPYTPVAPTALPAYLGGVDLDGTERALLGRFSPGGYYTGVVRLSGVPAGTTLSNVAAETPYHLPPLPGLYAVSPSAIPGLYDVKYGSLTPLSDAVVRREIRAGIERIAAAGTYPVQFEGFAVYSGHTPFELHVGPRDLAGGFYRRLNALQGHRHTFWSGATWHAHNSARIWTGLETLLPAIAEG